MYPVVDTPHIYVGNNTPCGNDSGRGVGIGIYPQLGAKHLSPRLVCADPVIVGYII